MHGAWLSADLESKSELASLPKRSTSQGPEADEQDLKSILSRKTRQSSENEHLLEALLLSEEPYRMRQENFLLGFRHVLIVS